MTALALVPPNPDRIMNAAPVKGSGSSHERRIRLSLHIAPEHLHADARRCPPLLARTRKGSLGGLIYSQL
jgi:hypothetical protein